MFRKAAVRVAIAFLAVVTILTVVGAVSPDHERVAMDIMQFSVLGIIGFFGIVLVGKGLSLLASWVYRLSLEQYLTFMFAWLVGWIAAGYIGETLFDSSVLAVASFLAGIFMAFSILVIRIRHIARANQTNAHPVNGHGPRIKGS